MSSYHELLTRVQTRRTIHEIACRVADSGFPLEEYLNFVFPRGNYLVTEESFADNNAGWGRTIGGALGAFGGPLGSLAGQWAGGKIGNWWGAKKDKAGAADPKYWQNRFNQAFKYMNDTVDQMVQATKAAPQMVQQLGVDQMVKQVNTAVQKFQGMTQTTPANAPQNAQKPQQPGNSIDTNQANQAVLDGQKQAAAAAAGGNQVNTNQVDASQTNTTMPAPGTVPGVVDNGSNSVVVGNSPDGTASTTSTAYDPYAGMTPEQKKNAQADYAAQTYNAWHTPQGRVFRESRLGRQRGYRRIDPRIWD